MVPNVLPLNSHGVRHVNVNAAAVNSLNFRRYIEINALIGWNTRLNIDKKIIMFVDKHTC